MRVVFANGIPIFHYAKADKAADHYAMIHLVESGLPSQQEVSAAFQCSRLTIFRSKRKFDQGGIAALVPRKTGPRDGFKMIPGLPSIPAVLSLPGADTNPMFDGVVRMGDHLFTNGEPGEDLCRQSCPVTYLHLPC